MTDLELIKKIDFGDIDGLFDPRLNEYFLNFNFKEDIVRGPKYFIIGRKGTGKSAIYKWIHNIQFEEDFLVSNLSFKDFPFEKFLGLSDDSFARPNQYQSIWRNIILSEICHLIVKDESNVIDDDYKEIFKYVKYIFGSDLIDLHKQVTRSTSKTSSGLSFTNFSGSLENSKELEYYDGFSNLTKINNRLTKVLSNYLKFNNERRYIIQFDQLDDNYTQYINNQDYFQSIISLFKTIYDINQTFRSQDINVQIIAYLRSDIFYSIDAFDSESARWDQYKMSLNWAIINRNDWNDPKLLQILNKRIDISLPELKSSDPFKIVFDNKKLNLEENGHALDFFKYMVHRSFQRPRDLIQFCIKVQIEARESNSLYFRTIKNAEKDYSLWLLSEVENEIAPKIKNIELLYELLRLLGENPYSVNEFRIRYSHFESRIGIDAEALLKLLYSFGIIMNLNFRKDYTEYFSIIRNDRSVFNRDLKIVTHRGFYLGLYTSKFLKRA